MNPQLHNASPSPSVLTDVARPQRLLDVSQGTSKADVAQTAVVMRGGVEANPAALRLQRSLALIVVFIPFLGFIAGIILLWGRGLGFVEVGLLAGFYLATMIGIEVGFHRLLSHHAFKCQTPVQAALIILGSMAVQGPVLFWVAIHRRHHAYSDQPGDPHSPNLHGEGRRARLNGLWHAHLGWLFNFNATDWTRFAPDLLRDRKIFRLHLMYPVWVLLGLLLPALLGGLLNGSWTGALNGFLWGGLARIFLVHHSIWGVNSLCHSYGKRAFQSRDHSTNNIWLALISLGGSWHNNHHAFPNAAKIGLSWWQLDPSGWFIQALQKIGWAGDVKSITPLMLAGKKKHSDTVDGRLRH